MHHVYMFESNYSSASQLTAPGYYSDAIMNLDQSDFNAHPFIEDCCNNYPFSTEPFPEIDNGSFYFENKSPLDWTTADILHWICHQGTKSFGHYEDIDLPAFNDLVACTFLTSTKEDFMKRQPEQGEWLYNCKEELLLRYNLDKFVKRNSNQPQSDKWPYESKNLTQHNAKENSNQLPPFSSLDYELRNIPHSSQQTVSYSDGESSTSSLEMVYQQQPVVKRSPGRPPKEQSSTIRRKPENTTGRLWEFIRNLLLNKEYCPKWIKWENYDEGTFKFVHSDKIAELWGQRKNNKKMNYEKLSRAMRYYYKSMVLLPVAGRRLVYKFGPTATGWKTDNPNFKNDQP